VLEPEENLGFGRAVNEVAHRTDSEWLLAANADIALEPGALTRLLEAGRSPRVGCVAPRLLLADGSTQHSVHPFPTVPLALAFNLGLHRLSSGIADRLCLEGYWDPDRSRPVPWAIGACLLLRRRALDEVGGFDQRQWMYAEDVDLAWRLRQAGWATHYEPSARVQHAASAATSIAFEDAQAERFMAATYAMLERRRGATRMWATGALNVVGAAARAALAAPLARRSDQDALRYAAHRRWLHAHLHGLRRRSTLPDSR
jgi:N-acetylglucosaminyl-diphospho-decaprenol L-rhamnosyltransferase